MKNRLSFYIFSISVVAFILTSCSSYNDVLRSDNYENKIVYADDFFEKKEYDKSTALYEQIYQHNPKGDAGEKAYFRMGKGYYFLGDFVMGNYFLSNFAVRFPYSDYTEEALYYSVVCAANLSPSYTLDQSDTENAIDAVQYFVDAYPDSKYMDDCNKLLDGLYGKLEKKAYESIKLYTKMEQYKAGVATSTNFLSAYPTSLYREEVYYMNVRNSFYLAINSVEDKKKGRIDKAIETYLNFVAEFPNTTYSREVKGYYSRLNKIVESI